VLSRGYSIARLPDGSVIRSWRQVDVGTLAEVILSEGSAEVAVRKPIPPSRRDQRA
jgi:hypothetical protein